MPSQVKQEADVCNDRWSIVIWLSMVTVKVFYNSSLCCSTAVILPDSINNDVNFV